MTIALRMEGVSKRYAGHLAVEELSLTVPTGSIYGVLGPNGAGKSTSIRIAMNIVARDSGAVALLGVDPATTRGVLARVGYLPEERGLYRKMRVLDVIEFFGRLKGMTAADARRAAGEWLERLGLGEWRRARVEQLSKGMQQKVQFITTVLHEPELLILDEPASGLDPVNQEVLRSAIRDARANGRTVILSTHNMAEAEQLCDFVCIIAEGRKVLDGSLREIRRVSRRNRWIVEYDLLPARAREAIASVAPPSAISAREHGWEIEIDGEEGAGALFAALASVGEPPTRVERIQPSLHEIFVAQVSSRADRPSRRA